MIVDGDGCGQEIFPIAVCVTTNLKKTLTEDTLFFNDSDISSIAMDVHNFLDFI